MNIQSIIVLISSLASGVQCLQQGSYEYFACMSAMACPGHFLTLPICIVANRQCLDMTPEQLQDFLANQDCRGPKCHPLFDSDNK
jgi:hypothetical protein